VKIQIQNFLTNDLNKKSISEFIKAEIFKSYNE